MLDTTLNTHQSWGRGRVNKVGEVGRHRNDRGRDRDSDRVPRHTDPPRSPAGDPDVVPRGETDKQTNRRQREGSVGHSGERWGRVDGDKIDRWLSGPAGIDAERG